MRTAPVGRVGSLSLIPQVGHSTIIAMKAPLVQIVQTAKLPLALAIPDARGFVRWNGIRQCGR